MHNDETQIRALVQSWMEASKAGDINAVLAMMSDDVVFMVPGAEPFGKEEFAARSKGMSGVKFDGTSEIIELQILGDWAWIRNRIQIVITPPGKEAMARSGYTLTILRKNAGGDWQIARDANLVTAQGGRD